MTQIEAFVENPDVVESQASFPLSLDEFCKRLSIDIKRPALIGGFYAFAKQQGLVLAQTDVFMSAFESFRRRPA